MNPNATAAIPTLTWLRIVEYASFHDVPRSMLVLDREMALKVEVNRLNVALAAVKGGQP